MESLKGDMQFKEIPRLILNQDKIIRILIPQFFKIQGMLYKGVISTLHQQGLHLSISQNKLSFKDMQIKISNQFLILSSLRHQYRSERCQVTHIIENNRSLEVPELKVGQQRREDWMVQEGQILIQLRKGSILKQSKGPQLTAQTLSIYILIQQDRI